MLPLLGTAREQLSRKGHTHPEEDVEGRRSPAGKPRGSTPVRGKKGVGVLSKEQLTKNQPSTFIRVACVFFMLFFPRTIPRQSSKSAATKNGD